MQGGSTFANPMWQSRTKQKSCNPHDSNLLIFDAVDAIYNIMPLPYFWREQGAVTE